jgi:hypothetical protein
MIIKNWNGCFNKSGPIYEKSTTNLFKGNINLFFLSEENNIKGFHKYENEHYDIKTCFIYSNFKKNILPKLSDKQRKVLGKIDLHKNTNDGVHFLENSYNIFSILDDTFEKGDFCEIELSDYLMNTFNNIWTNTIIKECSSYSN